MDASSINLFLNKCSRNQNDATNKVRETVLNHLQQLDDTYRTDPEYGESWRIVETAWHEALHDIAVKTKVPAYTRFSTVTKAGRGHSYDINVNYFDGGTEVASRHIEFKYGTSKIDKLPQFLSLQAKFPMFSKTYDVFFYESFLDAYLACDPELAIMAKPAFKDYIKMVSGTSSSDPFFIALKAHENVNKKGKANLVNSSIRAYLNTYASTLDMSAFYEKVNVSQAEKQYLLWHNGKFHYDSIDVGLQTDMSISGIKNGNVLMVKSGLKTFKLLLRWRNHKGILNPAWQISLQRD
jgi:hypothetical protein